MKEEFTSIEAMTCYLFVTDEERLPEKVESDEDDEWSCSKTTRKGNYAFVYIKGKGITYLWHIISDARQDSIGVTFATSNTFKILSQRLR